MKSTTPGDEDAALLRHYQSQVPDDLRQNLLRRLETQLPARRFNRRHLLGTAALAATLAFGAWLAFPSREAPDNQSHALNLPAMSPTTSVAGESGDADAGSNTSSGGFAEEIPAVPLIVRARISGWEDTRIEYTIEHVLYGALADKTLKIDALSSDPAYRKQSFDAARSRFVAAQHRDPTADKLLHFLLEERGYKKGREAILFLHPVKDGFEIAGSRFYDSPSSADEAEKRYAQLIRDGNVQFGKPGVIGR
jgi:hypothetical protein